MPAPTGAKRPQDTAASAAPADAATTPAALAKAALRRLAQERQEPTPENFRLAYEAEARQAGVPLPELTPPPAAEPAPAAGKQHWPDDEAGQRWSELIDKIVRGAERGGRQWTSARKKDSLQRVLQGSRQSGQRLHQRLSQLVSSWTSDSDDPTLMDSLDAETTAAPPTGVTDVAATASAAAQEAAGARVEPGVDDEARRWTPLARQALNHLHRTLQSALPADPAPSGEAAQQLQAAWASVDAAAPGAAGTEIDHAHRAAASALGEACEQARQVIEHRHLLSTRLTELVHVLTDSLVDLAEDDSWVQGQCVAMRHQLDEGLHHRGVRRMQQLLEVTRTRQRQLKLERAEAREALKALIHTMLQELAELGHTTDRFQDNLGRYADTIGQAESLESLTGLVREMVQESRAVQSVVSQTQQRLHAEHERATALTERVRELEDEIRKLSDEVSTDPLTQIANRRGMMRAFEAEQARALRQDTPLAIGLLDVDNFKKLNDTLGHQTGDEALKFLARQVSQRLRPVDVVARYGGEEFVVMLPDTPIDEAQQALTRLQRALSAEFFTHEDKKVFITFSAGVTLYRRDEPIEAALERADVALYEAKRTGKNRTCVA
ncbi:MAG: diguanylate cyclase [Aquabacterium sp.]|jgi:diguanylate cyclase